VACNLWRDVAHCGQHANAAVLDLHRSPALEGVGVAVLGQAERIEESNRRLSAKFVLECAEWRVSIERPVPPSAASESILEQHAHDRHHRQPSVGELRSKPPLPCLRVTAREERRPPAHVSRLVPLVDVSVVARIDLAEGGVRNNLEPAQAWHFGDGRQAVGNVGKLHFLREREVAWPVACNLWRDVAHCGQHANAAVLDLHRSPALEGVGVAVLGQAERIEESNRRLRSKLVFEGAQWGSSVQSPVTPSTARQAVLEEHADNRQHGKSPVRELRV